MKVLRRGDRGDAVKLLQERLAANGFKPGVADGVFGKKTDTAVLQFQAAQNLVADGIVGDKTWAALLAGEPIRPPPDLLDGARDALLANIPGGLGGQRKAVLDAAAATLGWAEQPNGSNGGPELDVISTGYKWWDYRNGKPPWCALAVCYWLKQGLGVATYEATPFKDRFGAVTQIEDWALQKGNSERPRIAQVAPAGSVFTMSRGGSGSDPSAALTAGHCGLVVRDDGRFVLTIEGNTGNQVTTRKRRKSELRWFVRWW